ncbi:ABC subfamily ABCG [Brachionus plicatilis]|uniref:ABC subfamily ABCG n=1 Tax=Brachionus plicatilis TaxID=10195 RepID=A0A3M7SA17_BRAPC|nr:ABC subfamily ABCG [Brachionus plicatilis]
MTNDNVPLLAFLKKLHNLNLQINNALYWNNSFNCYIVCEDEYDIFPSDYYPKKGHTRQNEKPESVRAYEIDSRRLVFSWVVNAHLNQKSSLLDKFKTFILRLDSNDDLEEEKILDNVCGYLQSGNFCAIMGSSGSGKTTLLNCLTLREKNLNVESDIRINGKSVDFSQLTHRSGFVKQNDLFIDVLTVKEWLTFQYYDIFKFVYNKFFFVHKIDYIMCSYFLTEDFFKKKAFMRIGDGWSYEQKYDRIDEVLVECNLEKIKDNFIGGLEFTKGISGGEKRLLSFATQILTKPEILFCDEPTTGLDTYTASIIIDILESQAKAGKIILCSIHQPSSQMFQKFTTLCLLSEGKLTYFGPRTDALKFFERVGFYCPFDYNPPDMFISALHVSVVNREQDLARVQKLFKNYWNY